MKQKITAKKSKKPNIPLLRRLAILRHRLVITFKLVIVITCYLFFFTKYLDFIKEDLIGIFNEKTADLGFRLDNILIEGQHNIALNEILATLNADTGTPIFSIDIKKIKSTLEQKQWIKNAVIERRLPSTLYIGLVERKPIAIWQINQKIFLVDEDGHTITTDHVEKFADLLHVVGTDANIYASKLIEDISTFPELAQKVLSAVRYGDRRWNLNLQQSITIKMPEDGFNKAWQYLGDLYKAGKLFDQNIKVIDLRSTSKYFIEKNPTSNKS